jgi:hypothetical protein
MSLPSDAVVGRSQRNRMLDDKVPLAEQDDVDADVHAGVLRVPDNHVLLVEQEQDACGRGHEDAGVDPKVRYGHKVELVARSVLRLHACPLSWRLHGRNAGWLNAYPEHVGVDGSVASVHEQLDEAEEVWLDGVAHPDDQGVAGEDVVFEAGHGRKQVLLAIALGMRVLLLLRVRVGVRTAKPARPRLYVCAGEKGPPWVGARKPVWPCDPQRPLGVRPRPGPRTKH